MLTSKKIKDFVYYLGADLCGIASIDRFADMPDMTNPGKILDGSKSVIVIAKHFLESALKSSSTVPYTIIRNFLSKKIDEMTIELSYYLESSGFASIPVGAISPCNYDTAISKTVGLISLKNAAVKAGLGTVGKNTLLITPEYGNLVWLGAIITTLELKPDNEIRDTACRDSCTLCIDNCPAGAITGDVFMDQSKCWNHAFGEDNGGEWRIKCFKCRSVCPYGRYGLT